MDGLAVVGTRQTNLAERLTDPKTRWRRVKVTGWYGRGERIVEIISGTALWHHPGRFVPIRYVLVRDLAGELRPQAFLCTDVKADPINILRWFVRRWSIEVTFCRSSAPPGRRKSTPVVRSSHRTHNASSARLVLARDTLGA